MTSFALVTMLALLNGGEASPVAVMQKHLISANAASWDNIDWVEFYKCRSCHINSQCSHGPVGGPVMFAPNWVRTQMQCSSPNSTLTGTPGGVPAPLLHVQWGTWNR